MKGLLVGMMLCIVSQLNAQDYKVFKDLPEFTIDYRTENCGAEPNVIFEMHFLRLTNKTDHAITVKFRIEYYYGGNCTTCNNNEYYHTFTIPANSSITTDCDKLKEQNGHLGILSRYLNRDFGTDLDKFEINNISVQ